MDSIVTHPSLAIEPPYPDGEAQPDLEAQPEQRDADSKCTKIKKICTARNIILAISAILAISSIVVALCYRPPAYVSGHLMDVLKYGNMVDPRACAAALEPWATPLYPQTSPLRKNAVAVFHGIEQDIETNLDAASKLRVSKLDIHGDRPTNTCRDDAGIKAFEDKKPKEGGWTEAACKTAGGTFTSAEKEVTNEVVKNGGQLRALEAFSIPFSKKHGRSPGSPFPGTAAFFTDEFETAADYGTKDAGAKSTLFIALIDPEHENVESHVYPDGESSPEIWYQAHPQRIQKKFDGEPRYKWDGDQTLKGNRRGPDPDDKEEDFGKKVPRDASTATHVVTIPVAEMESIVEACRI